MDEAYANHLSELEVLFQRVSEEHRKEAAGILTEVINAHKKALDKSMEDHAEYAKTISADIKTEMQPIIQAWVNSLNNAKRIGTLNVVASAMVFLSACVLAAVVFLK
jgi:redox-regulated HSP33 family molecular chaperone